MKNQNNRDKLNDALGMVDEELVQGAMLHVVGARAAHLSRRGVIRRRVAVATAACLSLCLIVGAMLAVPLLTADEPGTGEDTLYGGPTSSGDTPAEAPSYVEASIVRLDMLSSVETATISDPNIPVDELNVNFQQSTYFTNLHVLIFDCLPGETVTIRANRECLGHVGMVYDPEIDPYEWGAFQEACDNLRHRSVLDEYDKKNAYAKKYKGSEKSSDSNATEETYTFYERELTIDPFSSSVILCFDYSEPEDGVEEDVILYTVTNEAGQITGAGGLYVGKQYVNRPNPRTPDHAVTISRAAVLGSVRFIDPASVTEAQVEALHSTYAVEGKNGQSMVDFTPVTHEEINAVAGREILDTLFKNQFVMGIGRGIKYHADYSSFYVLTEDSDYEHEFIIFKDGTWAEIDCERGANASSNGHANAECPNTEKSGLHGIGNGCIVKTTDGRFYQLDEKTATLVENPTA